MKAYRRPKTGQHCATVVERGEYHPPRTGAIPTPVNRKKPWPERAQRREEQWQRELAQKAREPYQGRR